MIKFMLEREREIDRERDRESERETVTHFPKIHGSVLRKITIDLWYF